MKRGKVLLVPLVLHIEGLFYAKASEKTLYTDEMKLNFPKQLHLKYESY